MGNCQGYCNSCGDESTQIKTLDNSQFKHSMKEKENFIPGQYNGNFRGNQNQQFGSAAGQFAAQEGEEIDEDGRITRGPVTLKNGAIYTG